MKEEPGNAHRSPCPIAATLDFVGDKWSLILVRDMVVKKRRYREFLDSPEGIPTNILASRLKSLEGKGIIERRPYQTKPTRYEYVLTRKGVDLLPVLQQLAIWGYKHIPGRWKPPAWFLDARADDVLNS